MVKIFNLPKPLNHPPCSQPMPLTKDEKTAWKRLTAPNGERRARNLWKITTFKDSELTGMCSTRTVSNER